MLLGNATDAARCSLVVDVPPVRQVNWLATLPSRGAEGGDAPSAADVYVADTSRFLSHYTVRDG